MPIPSAKCRGHSASSTTALDSKVGLVDGTMQPAVAATLKPKAGLASGLPNAASRSSNALPTKWHIGWPMQLVAAPTLDSALDSEQGPVNSAMQQVEVPCAKPEVGPVDCPMLSAAEATTCAKS